MPGSLIFLILHRVLNMETDDLKIKIEDAKKLLIGLGKKELSDENVASLKKILEGRDYYIITSSENIDERLKDMNIVYPMSPDLKDEDWEKYLKWVSLTLNRELLVLELNVSFDHPEVIRFPFEKTVFYNLKSMLVRVNKTFYQIPEEIKERACGIKKDGFELLNEL